MQKEYKTRYDLVGRVIHWEVCKRLKFDHTTKWYKYNPKSIIVNEMQKILWDFEIQTGHPVPGSKVDIVLNNKKKRIYHFVDFIVPADHRVKMNEIEKIEKYLGLAGELKNQ